MFYCQHRNLQFEIKPETSPTRVKTSRFEDQDAYLGVRAHAFYNNNNNNNKRYTSEKHQ